MKHHIKHTDKMEKLWGGRFSKQIDKDFFEFQKSIHYDYKLAEYDIYHSFMHTRALQEAGILKNREANKLISGLEEILEEIKRKKFKPNLNSEDIHSDIQNRMKKKLGNLALKLHTLRSRNDQVVFDEKWYCLDETLKIRKLLVDLLKSMLFIVKSNRDQKLIGYTHTQRAQIVSFENYVGAFVNMFRRDDERLMRFYDNLFIYIGSGALAGSSLTKKNYEEAIRKTLDKDEFDKYKPVENLLDNVSDRDFIIEFLCVLAIVQMHLSRLADDFILYSTKEFNFIDLPEEFCTGSSLMPHKKNPDFLELVRGNTGRAYGNLISILTTMKGLPLTYNRDMQLDKEPLFSSLEVVKDELKIMAKFIRGVKLNKDIIKKALEDKTLYATELAEYLVREEDVPFRKAHDIVGKIIKYAEVKCKNKKIEEITDKVLKNFHPALNQNIIEKIMNAKYAASMKKTTSSR